MKNIYKIVIAGVVLICVVGSTLVFINDKPVNSSDVSNSNTSSINSQSKKEYSVPDIVPQDNVRENKKGTTSNADNISQPNTPVLDVSGSIPDNNTTPEEPKVIDDTTSESGEKPDSNPTQTPPSLNDNKDDNNNSPAENPSPSINEPPVNTAPSKDETPANTTPNKDTSTQPKNPSQNNTRGDPTSPFYFDGENPFEGDLPFTPFDGGDVTGQTGGGIHF